MTTPIYFAVGLLEWFLASQRTWSISQGEGVKASLWVLVENLIGFWVLFQFVQNVNNWPMAIAYSVGASLGTLLNMRVDL